MQGVPRAVIPSTTARDTARLAIRQDSRFSKRTTTATIHSVHEVLTVNDPKEEDNAARPLQPVRPHIMSRRLDIAAVSITFNDGESITIDNDGWTKLMCYRERENATGTREVALGETVERRWVEYDVSWSVDMVKDARGHWRLPE